MDRVWGGLPYDEMLAYAANSPDVRTGGGGEPPLQGYRQGEEKRKITTHAEKNENRLSSVLGRRGKYTTHCPTAQFRTA